MEEQSQPPVQPPTPPAQFPTLPAPRPAPARGMSAGAKWAIGCGVLVVLTALAVFVLFITAMVSAIGGAGRYGQLPGGNVALIRVEGTITAGASGGGPFAEAAAAERIVRQLQGAAEDAGVRAILVRINSPGGSAAGSQEIYQEIRRVRDEGKPVFASMGDVAASGGYYVASATERIFADPGTMTGSIGVISANLEMSGLFQKIGIKPQVLKEGEFKDMGSGLRPLTDQERQIIQSLLGNVYEQFVKAVADGRKGTLTEAQVRKLATGQVYTGEQALKLKLVDELGGLRPAVYAVARRAGIKGEPVVKEYRRRLLDVLLGDVSTSQSQGMKGILYDRLADLITRGALQTEE